jgi:hypothetical protein
MTKVGRDEGVIPTPGARDAVWLASGMPMERGMPVRRLALPLVAAEPAVAPTPTDAAAAQAQQSGLYVGRILMRSKKAKTISIEVGKGAQAETFTFRHIDPLPGIEHANADLFAIADSDPGQEVVREDPEHLPDRGRRTRRRCAGGVGASGHCRSASGHRGFPGCLTSSIAEVGSPRQCCYNHAVASQTIVASVT